MKRIHLLRFDGDPFQLGPFVDALRADGGRAGWLDLASADPVPPSLVAPASLDFLRAVAVGEQLTIAVKPMRGAPVQRDLLREHFRSIGAQYSRRASGTDGRQPGIREQAQIMALPEQKRTLLI